MFKKEIPYTDYNGENRTGTCYFNLNKTELMEIALDLPEDIFENTDGKSETEIVRMMVDKLGMKGLFKFLKELILKSYGEKSKDGLRFVKSEEISTAFSQTPMFDSMFTEMLGNDKAASDFINEVMPVSLVAQITDKISGSVTPNA